MSHIEKCRNLCHATLKIPEGLRGEPDAIRAEALRWGEALLELERAGDEGNAVKL